MNDVVIRPLRFTADVEAMRAFLETLGLRSRIESERGGWVDCWPAAGWSRCTMRPRSDTGGQAGADAVCRSRRRTSTS